MPRLNALTMIIIDYSKLLKDTGVYGLEDGYSKVNFIVIFLCAKATCYIILPFYTLLKTPETDCLPTKGTSTINYN